jgi:DNA helicase-2/ATP-dependent DNA helicase PcrA
VGDEVDHKIFGRGVVTAIQDDALTIRFKRTGETKKLLQGFAPLVKLS